MIEVKKDQEPKLPQVIAAAKKGDHQACQALVEQFGPAIYNFILKLVQRREVAEDLYQETWMRALQHLSNYAEQGQFRSWLFKIANRLCLSHFRRRRYHWVSLRPAQRGTLLPLSNSNDVARPDRPDEAFEQKERWQLMAKALQAMPFKQRQVFLLRMQGVPFREISAILERPLSTTLSQMRAAMQYMQKRIREYYDEL